MDGHCHINFILDAQVHLKKLLIAHSSAKINALLNMSMELELLTWELKHHGMVNIQVVIPHVAC